MENGKKTVESRAYWQAIIELAREGHEVSVPIVGESMNPMISSGRDCAVVAKLEREPKLLDVVLYTRPDGSYILHRVCAKRKNVLYIAGDFESRLEKVPREKVLLYASAFIRKGKRLSCGGFKWKAFSAVWLLLFPLRIPIINLFFGIKKLFTKKH